MNEMSKNTRLIFFDEVKHFIILIYHYHYYPLNVSIFIEDNNLTKQKMAQHGQKPLLK